MFFVISGYLITTILIEDIENRRFNIVNFYERRARRILPALFFVMLVCIPFAWMWMLPSQMKDFSQSLVAVSFFASNILFWRESGYFDAAAEEKPLLHTWSLAVEEQYYVLFPVFLILAWRFGRNRVFWMIVVMSAISLLLSEWGCRNKATANFYLAPTRAWELFAGSIAAFIVQKSGVRKNNTLALVGLSAIIFSIFAYNESTPFPSVYALVPVLGVVLLVLNADKETFAAKLLCTKVFVGIGLISYSAYLWHQPLLAFARINSIEEPSVLVRGMLALASLALAYFSWKYIETPFRNKLAINKTKILIFSVSGLLMFAAFGFVGYKTNGFAERESMSVFADLMYDNSSLGYLKCNDELDNVEPKLNYCFRGEGAVKRVLLGDSHADDKFHGLVQSSTDNNWMLLGNSSCPPLMEVNFKSADGMECTERLRKIFRFFHFRRGVDTVVISFAHMYPLDTLIAADQIKRNLKVSDGILEDKLGEAKTPSDVFAVGLFRTVDYLRNKGIKIVIATDIPELEFMPEDCLSKRVSCEFNRNDVLLRQKKHRDFLKEITNKFNDVRVFDSLDIFCSKGSGKCSILRDGRTLYRDSHHLSHYGSIVYGEHFISWLTD